MWSPHSSDDSRDDFQKYIDNVPKGSSVTAYVNETLDGVRLRHKNEIYEIPRDHLQSGIVNRLGEIHQSCKGIEQRTQQIKLRKETIRGEEEQTLVAADSDDRSYPINSPRRLVKNLRNRVFGGQHDPDASTWTWRERVPDRLERFPESITISPNDQEFSRVNQFSNMTFFNTLPITFHRPQGNNPLQIIFGPDPIRVNVQGEGNILLRQMVINRLSRLKRTLFSDDINELLTKKGDGEREFIQEKMLDAFEKQPEFEREMPTGISPQAAWFGSFIAYAIGMGASAGSSITGEIVSGIAKGVIGEIHPPVSALLSQGQHESEGAGEAQFGLAKHISDIAKSKLLENCIVQIRKGAEPWRPSYDLHEFNDGGTFKRDKTDGRFALFSASNSDESVRLPVEMVTYARALGKKGFNKLLETSGYQVSDLRLNKAEITRITPLQKGSRSGDQPLIPGISGTARAASSRSGALGGVTHGGGASSRQGRRR